MKEDDKEAMAGIEVKDAKKLENPTVKWLSFWDINPVNGKTVPVHLEMFENVYGGKIEYIQTTFDDKYDKLGTMIASGDSPDMFPAADLDTFPKGAAAKMFEPLDDYIDFDSDLWKDMSVVNDRFVYNGGYYVGATGTDAGTVMIYNQKTIENNNIEDPQELLANGNWTWDTFNEMMNNFCDKDEKKYAIDGWWFVWAFSATTGVPIIEMKDGKAVHNLNNALIEKSQEFMKNMYTNNYPYPKWEYNWQINPSNISNGNTLFYPCGMWSLYEADLSDYGDTKDIRFVPMPRCPYADEYYLPTGLEAYSLCKGAQNPEGVAAFLNCGRITRNDDTAKEISKKQLFEDYKWSEEMYNCLETVQDLTEKHPVIDLYAGVSAQCKELLNNPVKDSFNNGASWTQTRESIIPAVQAELDTVNARLNS